MIVLDNVSKRFATADGPKCVADRISLRFPSRVPVALLGRNGTGKSTLLQMIAGTVRPDAGRILRRGRVSWPVGFAGSFHPDLTGAQNVRFAGRLYGVDVPRLVARVAAFAELGPHFEMPVRTYSTGMRGRLAFGLSMFLPFETYLVDEVASVGDLAFKRRSEALLTRRLESSGAIVVSHALGLVQRICRHGVVLENGRATYHTDIDDAIRHHQAVMRGGAIPEPAPPGSCSTRMARPHLLVRRVA